MIAAVAGVSTFVVFRNARVDLLMSGQAPGVNEIGVIGGAVCAATPLIIYGWLPGLVGVLSAVLASGLIGYLALNIAMSGYRSIE
jgi:type IV secretory pathway TrbD component